MKRTILMQFILAVALGGCAAEGVTKGPATYAVVGVVGKPAASMDYGHVNLTDISIGNDTLRKDFSAFRDITTRSILKLEIVSLPTNVTALLGPNFNTPEVAKAKIKNTTPVVFIECGWVYMTGQAPRIETPYGSAGADGSTIAMQLTESSGTPVHRFYFLKGSSAWAKTITMNMPLPAIGTYVDIKSDGTITAPAQISSNGDATIFRDSLLSVAAAAI